MDWRLIGGVKADGHISIADTHADALAQDRAAPFVVGGGDDFDRLPMDWNFFGFGNGQGTNTSATQEFPHLPQ